MRLRQRFHPWMFSSAVWFVVAIANGFNYAVERRASGAPPTLHDVVFAGSGGFFAVALISPAVFALSRRWPIGAGHLARTAALHAAFAFLFWVAVSVTFQGILAALFNPHAGTNLDQLGARVYGWWHGTLPVGIVIYAASVAIEHAVRNFSEARARDVQVARLAEQLSSAQYSALQAQLNPHFLFNTLNTIAVRARDGDGPGTARMVEQLSEMLRRTLARDRASEVAIDEEIDLVREYLAIEEARFPDRLRPSIHVDDSALGAAVPSFALQHLVENAIRHGISRRPGAGRIRLDVRRSGEMLEAVVTDDGPGLRADAGAPKGHGIDNTRRRLEALYGDRATLALTTSPDGGAVATLRVPYRAITAEVSVA